MGKHSVESGDNLWDLAGGNSARYEMLIECNCQHPNIKNREREDPHFGWLDIGECIEIPWRQEHDPDCILEAMLSALGITNGDDPVDKACLCRKCALYLKVIDFYTEEPIANASVSISPGPNDGKTDNEGRIVFAQLVDRDYAIEIKATDYNTEIRTVPSHCVGKKRELTVPLYQEKPCNELFTEYVQSHGLTQAPKDPRTYGKWGTLTRQDFSKDQFSEAVQNQYNFGSGDYVVDPELWEMHEAIDIGQQIRDSITNGGGMSHWYKQASAQKNRPISFVWADDNEDDKIRRRGFNLDPDEAIDTMAWQFGRVAATIKEGIIVVCEDGSYFAKGRLVYESDTFSWESDGDGFWHNVGIFILGNNWNDPRVGSWQHGSITSEMSLNDPSIKKFEAFVFDASPGESYVQWRVNSKSYTDGNMPVHYARDYYFCTHGTKP